MEPQSILSEKGKKLLVVNNYKFGKAHVFKCVKIRWRCVQRTCSSKIYTGNDETTIMESNFQHNHEADITLNRQIVSNHLKRKKVTYGIYELYSIYVHDMSIQ
jgi:hypothetical protein